MALKEARRIVLEVYKSASPGSSDTPMQSVGQDTIALGMNLHVCVVEWRSTTPLVENHVYGYDVLTRVLGDDSTIRRLGDLLPNLLEEPYKLGYGERLPSFVVPPKLRDLVIIHGSCRKPHGNESDAGDSLVLVDDLLQRSFNSATQRPHFMIFTGDQIYADDVSVSLLATLQATARDLLRWESDEKFPAPLDSANPVGPTDVSLIAGPNRKDYIARETKFTSTLTDGHLMFLGEFYAMYLLAWSDALWPRATGVANPPIRLPSADELRSGIEPSVGRLKTEGDGYLKKIDEDRARVHTFADSLPRVRRALANTPSLMMFDDHDVTDDWYLNGEWVSNVCARAAGRQLMRNALASYAVFQDWGNHPENFATGSVGERILNALKLGPGAPLPLIQSQPSFLDVAFDLRPQRTPFDQRMRWDWQYAVPDADYQIVALDTRTFRGFPATNRDPAALIATDHTKTDAQLITDTVPMGFQLLAHKPLDNRVTILLSPAPVIGHPIAEFGQRAAAMVPPPSIPKLEAELAECVADLAEEKQKTPPGFDPLISQLEARIEHLRVKIKVAKSAPSVEAEYDMEPWSANRSAFEDLLGRLASFSQVVILSGDVHYVFSAEMAYFRTKPSLKARIVQFCSSSLRNQDRKTLMLGDIGFEGIPPMLGWLGFDRDLTTFATEFKAGVDTRILSANTNDPAMRANLARLYFLTEMNDRLKKPAVIPSTGYFDKPLRIRIRNLARDPNDQHDLTDWRYAVRYLTDTRDVTTRTMDWTALRNALGMAAGDGHRNRMLIGSARSVVGSNNIGVVRFSASVAGAPIDRVSHRIYWQVVVGTTGQTQRFTMFTEHTANLAVPTDSERPEVLP
ncbi:MAG: hypothetical protein LV473_06460 [Nitrospira sp.]|nr:hypothetical protein [Nitrospira sp.]